MIKILTVLGARPQFIKAAAVSREISKYKEIEEIIVHTGQHYEHKMSDIFFDEMQIPKPKYHLDINSLSHGAMTGRMMEGLEKIIIDEKPDYVMVYGDTNSTLAGALTAKKLHIKVIHVESGLRSFNMRMPEEINRILTDRISDILFCPTEAAVLNLDREGFKNFESKIFKNGDVMQDAAMFYSKLAEEKSEILNILELKKDNFVLCTIHRQENTDNIDNLKNISLGLDKINNEIQVIVPLHPRTKKVMEKNNIIPNFKIIDPLGYFDMIQLIRNCSLVMTDSGGLQKEAFFFEKNCVTLREQTEWIELIENGFNVLAKADVDDIYNKYKIMRNEKSEFNIDLYGNGNASKFIIEKILQN